MITNLITGYFWASSYFSGLSIAFFNYEIAMMLEHI